MKAIIISGMPAVGKTTVSKQVASALKVSMVGGGDVLNLAGPGAHPPEVSPARR